MSQEDEYQLHRVKILKAVIQGKPGNPQMPDKFRDKARNNSKQKLIKQRALGGLITALRKPEFVKKDSFVCYKAAYKVQTGYL
jgi:hypothetical protein